jgi:predicted nucleic acid-binding protein
MSVSRAFVDANVLVYAHDRTAGDKHARAVELMDRLWMEETGQVSVQVLQEFFVTVTRKVAQPLDPLAAEGLVKEFAAWPVFSPTADDVLAAIALSRSARLSFWDAMILHAAAESGCEVCWSEDLNDGQRWRGVQIRNPFDTSEAAPQRRRSARAKGM